MRLIVFIVAAFYFALAVFMWTAPMTWYETTPGVAMMGPFNSHFVRDVALAFLMSGAAMCFGVVKLERNVTYFGLAWPCAHALFHVWIWLTRGAPFDLVAAANLAGIQLPAWLALFCAFSFFKKRT
ncbi:MAG: hypothetical protein AAGA09_08205 [Pseudomonadota bacterium]